MIPKVTFSDPIAETITILIAGLDDTDVHAWRPSEHPLKPAVQVNLDGDDVTYPIITDALVRVSVWGADAGDVYDMAQECQSVLLSHSGRILVGYRSNGGPIPGVDPDTGDSFATFTVTARIRATTK